MENNQIIIFVVMIVAILIFYYIYKSSSKIAEIKIVTDEKNADINCNINSDKNGKLLGYQCHIGQSKE